MIKNFLKMFALSIMLGCPIEGMESNPRILGTIGDSKVPMCYKIYTMFDMNNTSDFDDKRNFIALGVGVEKSEIKKNPEIFDKIWNDKDKAFFYICNYSRNNPISEVASNMLNDLRKNENAYGKFKRVFNAIKDSIYPQFRNNKEDLNPKLSGFVLPATCNDTHYLVFQPIYPGNRSELCKDRCVLSRLKNLTFADYSALEEKLSKTDCINIKTHLDTLKDKINGRIESKEGACKKCRENSDNKNAPAVNANASQVKSEEENKDPFENVTVKQLK